MVMGLMLSLILFSRSSELIMSVFCCIASSLRFDEDYTHKNSVVFVEIQLTEKPWPDGLDLAFQPCKPGQSHYEAIIMAWLGLAWLTSA